MMSEPPVGLRGSEFEKGWLRFVFLEGEIWITDKDGRPLPNQPEPRDPEELLREDYGFADAEIEHATGTCPTDCHLCALFSSGAYSA